MTESGWTVIDVPGALPVLGHIWRLRKGLLRFLCSLPANADLAGVRIGPWRGYVVCHPDLVHEILLDNRTFDRGGRLFDEARALFGNGLSVCPRRDHRRQRRLVQPAFQRARVAAYADVMTGQIDAMMRGWQPDSVLDVPAQTHTLTSRVVARTFFSGAAADRAAAMVAECVPDLADGLYWNMMVPRGLRFLSLAQWRFTRARRRTHDAVAAVVQAHRQGPGQQDDLLAVLMAAHGDDDAPLTDREIQDQVATLMVTGIETAASTLSWALHAISGRRELQQRLQREADTVLAGRTAAWQDLEHLDLTARVINETLRLYAPAWMATRTTSIAITVGDRTIPAGTTILYSPYLLHHRADLYPHPESFDPERWGPQANPPLRHAFIPFGNGPHKCVGDTYAVTLTTLALTSIAARWEISPVTDRPVRPAARAILAPRSLRLRVRRREKGKPCHGTTNPAADSAALLPDPARRPSSR